MTKSEGYFFLLSLFLAPVYSFSSSLWTAVGWVPHRHTFISGNIFISALLRAAVWASRLYIGSVGGGLEEGNVFFTTH
ncbi:hypothetical protein J3E69DRAFT_41346 [Trichoderma sp. SZMC 28015]